MRSTNRWLLLLAVTLGLATMGPASAYPIPLGTVDHETPHHDWEGLTGADPTAACAIAIDPTCEHFYLIVEQPMRAVTIGAARDDCEEGSPGCVALHVRIFAMDAAHTLLAEGPEAASISSVAAGSTLDVQVSGPSDGAVGLTPYLGYVRSCPQVPGPPQCLPTTGR